MTPKEITLMIEKEIGGDWSISNWHACDLKKCLIRPKRRKVIWHDGAREVWIVLEEDPIELDKIKIYFDEETKKFGLIMPSREGFGFAVNSHDTFLEAFKAM